MKTGNQENQDMILLGGRLNGNQRNRLARLLNMMYMPSELAEEIGFNVRQVYRVYVPARCPHEKDGRNRLWLNGKAFCDWYHEVYKKRVLADDQAFCLTCKKAVTMIDPIFKEKVRIVYAECVCTHCGRKVARIMEQKRR